MRTGRWNQNPGAVKTPRPRCVYTVDYIQYSTEAYIRYCTAFNGSCKRESTCRLVFELSSSFAPPQ